MIAHMAVKGTVGVATLGVHRVANYASGATQAILADSLGLVGCAVGLGVWSAKKVVAQAQEPVKA